MSRAFGDFLLKDHGVIAIPDISYRTLTSSDQFIVLASDGVRVICLEEHFHNFFRLNYIFSLYTLYLFSISSLYVKFFQFNSYIFITIFNFVIIIYCFYNIIYWS